jgi:hypothetical protein
MYKSISGKDLSKGVPIFSPRYFDRLFAEHDLKKKAKIPIEQVHVFFYFFHLLYYLLYTNI